MNFKSLQNQLYKSKKLIEQVKQLKTPLVLNEQDQEKKELLQNSFYEFVKEFWEIASGGTKYVDCWHIQAMAEHLQALYNLTIKNLIINIPPRLGKSTIVNILYPAWVWANDPYQSFLYSSYLVKLAERDAIIFRELVTNKKYLKYFPISIKTNRLVQLVNYNSGSRTIITIGSGTGYGADFQIVDDPNSVKQSESKLERDKTNAWHDITMSSRFKNANCFRRLVVQQRLDTDDLSGYILAKNDPSWVLLRLPMEFDQHLSIPTVRLNNSLKIWKDPRTKPGELLAPALFNKDQLNDFKKYAFSNNEYRIAGQLQQIPVPKGGGLFKRSWFQLWDKPHIPKFRYIVQSWDTALTGKIDTNNACYSACTTWGVFDIGNGRRNIMLLSSFKMQLEYPELLIMAQRLYENYLDTDFLNPIGGSNKPNNVLIEQKVSGYSLASDLERIKVPVFRFNPNPFGDKEARARRITDIFSSNCVWFLSKYPVTKGKKAIPDEYAQLLMGDALNFPKGDSKDIVDSMSQALIFIKQNDNLVIGDDFFDASEFMRDVHRQANKIINEEVFKQYRKF